MRHQVLGFGEVGSSMAYVFDNQTSVGKRLGIVSDIAQDADDKRGRMRLEATRDHATHVWGVRWEDEKAVIARFDSEKGKYLSELEKMAPLDFTKEGVRRIG